VFLDFVSVGMYQSVEKRRKEIYKKKKKEKERWEGLTKRDKVWQAGSE
jgi:hypothetical protein